ncbi:MAG: NUDIX hydrolase [Saprospiraceae bacterium]
MLNMESGTRIKVRLILYDRGKILLLKQTKPNGGNYTLVGGNMEKGEYAKQTLIRESFEEAGINLKKKDLTLVHVLQKNNAVEQRLTLYFKAYRWEGKLQAKEPWKFKTVKWFSLDALPPNLTPTVRHVLQQYRQGRFYSEWKNE